MADALTIGTAITLFGVNCWDESVEEEYGRYRACADRVIVCKWNDRYSLVNSITGSSVVTGGVVVVNAGATYPDNGGLRVETVKIKGIPGDYGGGVCGITTGPFGMVGYKYARLFIRYSTLDIGATNVDYGTQIIHTPNSEPWLHYTDGAAEDVPTEDAPPIIMPGSRIRKMLRGITRVPFDIIQFAEAAPRNSAPCFGYPAGRVLFDGAKSAYRQTSQNIQNYDLELSFVTRGYDWNSLISKSGAIRPVMRNNGDPLYASYDLNNLLGPF